ncbi:adenylate/guanylate cyclase domain-containing protein [Glycomyces sambucus]|uniref:adenylate/guanylate cyclase domain-containing protein n=1 Tax=Glycomyces sambucus TaxID=380244 RepID=UPI000A67FDE2|nr:adenylate/guanylate cyclase domain-containing protein [Glycomyces sambucus]
MPTVPGARYCHNCGAPLSPEATAPQTERRYVTVLFGDLSDFTTWSESLDPERVSSVTDRLLAECVNAVNEFGGHVDKLTGDGIMAVFGAPLSHEDDAERAVRAAQAMQKRVRRLLKAESGGGLPIGLRIGLRSGLVVAGMQANLEYTVIGDTVNTAARICAIASIGTIWAGEETMRATKHAASWRRLTPVRLKGKREPVEVFQLLGLEDEPGTRASLGDTAPFIGRDAEIGRVTGRLEAVIDRAEPLVLIHTAEAGMGKTRFAREVRTLATERGARVLTVRVAPYGEGRRFGPLADLVRKAAGLRFDDDRATAEAKLRRIADGHPDHGECRLNITLLLGLLGHGRPGAADRVGGFTGQQSDAYTIPEAVAELITHMSTHGPLVLIIDDLHTASKDGIDALGVALAKIHGPVLVLLYGRPELTRSSGVLTRISEAEVHPLPPLAGADAARLLREFLGGGRLPKPDEDRLLGFAQGNPYYLAELVTLLTEQGLLSGTGDQWRLAAGSLTGKVLSRDLAQVLGARIDALTPAARALLRAASIFGDAVPPEATQLLEKEVPGEFDLALQELLDRRMLRRRSYGGYRFVTPLLRQAAYAPIGKADAAHAHAEIARWAADTELEGQSADDLVVFHAEQAVTLAREVEIEAIDEVWNVLPLAVDAVRKQADRAMDASEPERAVALLNGVERIATLSSDDRLLRGRALTRLGRTVEAEAEIEGLAIDIGLIPDEDHTDDHADEHGTDDHPSPRLFGDDFPEDASELVAQLLLLRGRLHRYKGELAEARGAWTAALALSRREGLAGPRCDAQCRIGLLDFLAGHLSEAETRFLDAYDVAYGVGDDKRLAWALQHRAWVLVARGDFDGADEVLREAAKAFARQMDLVGRAWVRGVSAFALLMAGRFTEAKRLSDVFMPIGERSGDVFAVGLLRAIGAAAQIGLGHPEGADALARKSFRDFERIDDDWGRGFAKYVRALAARSIGALDHALDLAAGAEEYGAKTGHPLLISLAHNLRGRCALEAGDPATAEAAAEEALALVTDDVLEPGRAANTALLADVRAAKGDRAAALRMLEPLAAHYDEPSLGRPRRAIVARYARLLDEDGRPDEAAEWAGIALKSFGEDPEATAWAAHYLDAPESREAECLSAASEHGAASKHRTASDHNAASEHSAAAASAEGAATVDAAGLDGTRVAGA